MKIFRTPSIRLSFSLVLLTINLLFLADLFGLVPDISKSTLELRKGLSESLAVQFSAVAERGEYQIIQDTLREVVERNGDIRSAAIRTTDGQLIALAGEHLAHWDAPADGHSTPTHVQVPIYRKGKHWATVQIRFAPLLVSSFAGRFSNSILGLVSFITLSGFICYFLVIKRTLRQLDPTTVIPERVQNAFDVLKEGVLIVDEKEQIVLVNESFARMFGGTPDKMIGLKGSELGWLDCQHRDQVMQLPWMKILKGGKEQWTSSLSLMDGRGRKVKFAVNAGIIKDNTGKARGSMVTFDDLTQLEEKNFELNELLDRLKLSHVEVQMKSQELEFLANHDPMTQCLNRRALDRKLIALFNKFKKEEKELSCLMIDIDHFKFVNDRFGHAVGDQVIISVADVLKSSVRESDLVGRYGGEEFCVILPGLSQDQAEQIAERIRQTIEKKNCAGVIITSSIGISSLAHQANKPDDLVNQADKALYAAKQSGRNRVVLWGAEPPLLGGRIESAVKAAEDAFIRSPEEERHYLKRQVRELEGLLKQQALEFEHYEMYDSRTGLPTRFLFEDRLGREIGRGKRNDYLVAVVSIDISAIKRVYETLGNNAGDSLLIACGQRLNEALREHMDTVAFVGELRDISSVSLISQTEFALFLTEIKQVDNVTWAIKRLLDAFEKLFRVAEHDIYASPYLGISLFPHDGQNVEDLFASAVHARNFAQKSKGNGRYMFASQELNEVAVKQLQIESALNAAVQKEELALFYQPQLETKTSRIVGFEALVRWNNNRMGIIPPSELIPVAEHSGQIQLLGDWVLYSACLQIRSWLEAGIEVGRIAVNLSGIQLCQRDLVGTIQKILEEFQLEAHRLEIELTESTLMDTYDKSFSTLKRIKDLGLRITMDDFGTGYSSLAYLRDIPLSCLKIDRSFIADIGKNAGSEKLIALIISMAHSLGLEVVGEGVEKRHQAEYLTALGCEYLQGYYFGEPLSPLAVADLLQKEKLTGSAMVFN